MTEFVMGGIPQEQTKGLKHAYLEIRHPGHHRNLPETSRKVGENQLLTERSCLATAVGGVKQGSAGSMKRGASAPLLLSGMVGGIWPYRPAASSIKVGSISGISSEAHTGQ